MSTETIRGTVEVSDPFVGVHEAVLAGVDTQWSAEPQPSSQTSTLKTDRLVARSIRVRHLLLPTFRDTCGPPDLCVVYKRWRTALSGKASSRTNETMATDTTRPPTSTSPLDDASVMEVNASDVKTRSTELTAWFHFVRGVWHRTPAEAASYLGSLVMQGLETASWYASGSYRIERAACFAYNCFTNEDIVVEAQFPGCTSVRRLGGPRPFGFHDLDKDPNSASIEPPEELDQTQWAQLSVSSVLRSVEAAGERPLYPALKVVAALDANWRGEALFLDAAVCTLSQWKMAGSRFTEHSQATAASSIVAEGIWQYFSRYARYHKAYRFFSDLVEKSGERALILYVARALAAQQQHGKARVLLVEVLDSSKESKPLQVVDRQRLALALAEYEVLSGHLTEAMDRIQFDVLPRRSRAQHSQEDEQSTFTAPPATSQDAINLRSTSDEISRIACFLLARLYAQTGEYESALRALNMAHVEPPQMDWFLRQVTAQDPTPNTSGNPVGKRQVTQPRAGYAAGTDVVRVLARRLAEERIGAGAFGEGRERHHADRILGDLTGSVLTPEEREAYDILVKIVNRVGWDELLHIRSRVFIMESDVLANVVDVDEPVSPPVVAETDHGVQDLSAASHAANNPDASATQMPGASSPSSAHGEDSIGPVATAFADKGATGANAETGAALSLADTRRQLDPSALNKALCTAWLDTLIHCLYEDLRAWSIWQHEERTLFESTHSAETTDAERVEVADPTPLVACALVIRETRRAAVDWLRRGELAERLGHPEMAERAYRICLGVAERSQTAALTAWLRLAALQTEHGQADEVVQALDQVWQYMTEHADKGDATNERLIPEMLQVLLYQAVARFGLSAVREAVSGLRQHQERMRSLLLDAVAAQVSGYDR